MVKDIRFLITPLVITIALAVCGAVPRATAQTVGLDRKQGNEIIELIKNDIRKNYYDPTFRGKDLDAHFRTAEEKIKEAPSMGHIFAIIVQSLIDFNDSHTYFLLPRPPDHIEHGWRVQMIGDDLYIIAVKPKSDAEVQGVKPGDKVLSIDGYTPERVPKWQMSFTYYMLNSSPKRVLHLEQPDGTQRELTISAEVKPGKKVLTIGDTRGTDLYTLIREAESEAYLNRHRYYEASDQAVIWKMPNFYLSNGQLDDLLGKVIKRKALILDLRGNGGGSETVLQRLLGSVFDHDVKIGDLKRRTGVTSLIAKTRGDQVFRGQLIVLIDSESGSAAELFARVVQLEKRGIVVGDRSAGAVMRSMMHTHQPGAGMRGYYYGVSVTDADIIMIDGKSLERVGVIPDELLLPKPSDLLARRDPVLARAAELAGIKLDPQKAGALFRIEWR